MGGSKPKVSLKKEFTCIKDLLKEEWFVGADKVIKLKESLGLGLKDVKC